MLTQIMRKLAPFISIASLLIILTMSVQVFLGNTGKEVYIALTNISTLTWFLFSPFWLIAGKKKD